ncbi:hypothetical protein AALO_G00027070 [Alosa alosa]|uniref:Teneurin N-terminal domain-containing protein n=1 Tax=Alosa alosa TaxID=278164 RepID=A0AAV6HD71_9TELE|nr:hypothetical protein AALO_G00027070 [Alosa alosa]
MNQMNNKPYQSLSRARPDMELCYSSSSEESEEGGGPPNHLQQQQPYGHTHSSGQYSHDRRLAYNSHRIKRKSSPQPCTDEDFLHAPSSQHSYAGGVSVGAGSDPDTEPEGPASPDHALHLWMQEVKSEHGGGSALSSRANSILSLTDTEQERKSDVDNGKTPQLHSY